MIERALVEAVIDPYHVKVRIPTFNKGANANGATPTSELSVCPIATVPGCAPALKAGDMVVVGFEHDDTAEPIVIGLFFNKNSDRTVSDVHVNSLKVDVDVSLPENTSIGNISSTVIRNLDGLNKNAQLQFDELFKEVEKLKQELVELREYVNDERVREWTQ